METNATVTVSFEPTKIVAVIRRCRSCGAVIARTFRDAKHPGKFSAPHTCPPPPAAAIALAA